MWSPPEITVKELMVWINQNKIKHAELAPAIGISIHTLQQWLYKKDRQTPVPKWMACAIASCVAFSGAPGLFGIRLVDVNVAMHLARGLKAAQLPKGQRSIADAKAIGYANQIADRLSRVTIIHAEPQVRTDPTSRKENPDEEAARPTGS